MKLLALLLAASASAAPVAPSSSATEASSKFDPAEVVRACSGGGLDVDDLLARGSSVLGLALFSPENSYAAEVDGYLLCQTLAGRAPSCRSVAARDAFCRDEAAFARFIYAAFRERDAVEKCRAAIPKSAGIPPGAVERLCAMLADGLKRGRPAAEVCEKARATGLPGDQASCEADLAYLAGEPQRCPAVAGRPEAQANCRRRAQLVSALRAGPCAAVPQCAALESGSAQSCGRAREDAARAICADLATFAKRAENATAGAGPTLEERKKRDKEEVAKQTKERRKADDEKAAAPLRDQALAKVAEKEAKRQEAEKQRAKRAFKEGEAMQNLPPDVEKRMKEIEEKGKKSP